MLQTVLSISAISLVLVFSFISLIKKERTVSDYLLVLVLCIAAVPELSDLLSIVRPDDALYWKRMTLGGESFLPGLGLLYSLAHARDFSLARLPLPQKILVAVSFLFPIVALGAPIDAFFYSPDIEQERVLFLGNIGFAFYIGVLVCFIIALFNLESTYLSASLASRWKIKFETIGVGFILMVLIFYYSQGLLYRTINMNLMPMRSLAMMAGVLLVTYSRVARGGGARIQVSRNLAYKSVVLLIVGLYLVGLGLMGEGLKYFGESFKRSFVIGVALVGGIVLLIALLSETVKRKIRVFLHKNFYQNKYDYRTQWLQFTSRLSASKSREELLRSILSGYCEIFGMSCGALFVREEGNHEGDFHVEATFEMETPGGRIHPDDAVVRVMTDKKWVVNLREDSGDLDTERSGLGRMEEMVFVVPLFLDDLLDGFIVLGKQMSPDETYNYEDYDLMKTLASQALSAILNLRLSDELSHAREMAAIGKVSAFVAHDLKNLVYTVSLILDNARDYMDNPEFQQDMLESLTNTVTRMNGLIAKLKSLPEKTVLQKKPADLLALVNNAAALVTGGELRVDGVSVTTEVDAEEIEKVVLNLVVNALDATGGRGPVTIQVGSANDAYIRVADLGCGMPEEFLLHQLFQPFRTTKKKGLGIGLYQCRQIVNAHGGRIEAASEVGKGSVFTVHLPLKGVRGEV